MAGQPDATPKGAGVKALSSRLLQMKFMKRGQVAEASTQAASSRANVQASHGDAACPIGKGGDLCRCNATCLCICTGCTWQTIRGREMDCSDARRGLHCHIRARPPSRSVAWAHGLWRLQSSPRATPGLPQQLSCGHAASHKAITLSIQQLGAPCSLMFAMMVQEEAQTRLQEAKRKRDGSSMPAKQEGEGAGSMQETVGQSMRMQKRAKHPKR